MTKMPLKENISKVFFVFSQCFFCYYHVSLGAIQYFTRYKKQKRTYTCTPPEGSWEAFAHFGWCLSTSENALSSRLQKRPHVLFPVEWCVSMLMVQFVVGGLVFFFSSLSSLEKYSLTLFLIGISTCSLFFIFILILGSF